MNTSIDERSLSSTGSLKSAQVLREMQGIDFELKTVRADYYRDWGDDILRSYPIVCSSTIIKHYIITIPVELTFDLSNDVTQLTGSLDVQQYLQHDFTVKNPCIAMSRPHDTSPRSLSIYLQGNEIKSPPKYYWNQIVLRFTQCNVRLDGSLPHDLSSTNSPLQTRPKTKND